MCRSARGATLYLEKFDLVLCAESFHEPDVALLIAAAGKDTEMCLAPEGKRKQAPDFSQTMRIRTWKKGASSLLVESFRSLVETTGKTVVDQGGFQHLLKCGVDVHRRSSISEKRHSKYGALSSILTCCSQRPSHHLPFRHCSTEVLAENLAGKVKKHRLSFCGTLKPNSYSKPAMITTTRKDLLYSHDTLQESKWKESLAHARHV